MQGILATFIAQLPEHVRKLEALLRQENLEELRRAVHQLKGAGGGYGFPTITETAAVAEQRIKASGSFDVIARQVDALITLIRRVDGYDRSRENIRAPESPRH
jgi:HPt (histidine-containing phosphotransfer) domain-containing protein